LGNKTTQHITEMIRKSDNSAEEVEKLDNALNKLNNARICITSSEIWPAVAGNIYSASGQLYNAHATAKDGVGGIFWRWQATRMNTENPFKGLIFVPPVIKIGVIWIEADGTVHTAGHYNLSIGAEQLETANVPGQKVSVKARAYAPSLIYDGTPNFNRQAALIPRGGGAYEIEISGTNEYSADWLGKATGGRYDT
jgi:hypothetical protein